MNNRAPYLSPPPLAGEGKGLLRSVAGIEAFILPKSLGEGAPQSVFRLPKRAIALQIPYRAFYISPIRCGNGFGAMRMVLRLIACLAVVVPALSASAIAQDVRVPSSAGEIRLSYAPVVKRVAPAVVNVYAARVVENRFPMFDDPIFRRFFGGGKEQVQRSLGSGVIVDPSGLVVTNFHVIENADQIKISLADKREFEADIVLKDQRSDLAVLRLKDVRERFAAIDLGDSDALQVGDVVLALGNPFGVGQTVTHGIVSAVARTQVGITDYQFFIQTDAAINPGNSGGALVDTSGRLVGINTAIFSRSGGSQGIGFAIPANMVKVVVASAKGGGSAVKRPWLGALLQTEYDQIGRTESLIHVNRAIMNEKPKDPEARLKLAYLYESRGERAEAAHLWAQIDPAGESRKVAVAGE